MLEIMEPSDLVVRCEFERENVVVPEEARFMGRGLDFCLDVFDYTEYSAEEVREKCRIEPQVLEKTKAWERRRLAGENLTPCFFVESLQIWEETVIPHNGKFTLGVVGSRPGPRAGAGGRERQGGGYIHDLRDAGGRLRPRQRGVPREAAL